MPKPFAKKIMIVRHAEKPDSNNQGVTEAGESNKRDLIVHGWQRAGALICFFDAAFGGPQRQSIAQPQFLFASAPGNGGNDDSKSNRPLETLLPLSRRLGLPINDSFKKGQESALTATVLGRQGIVLIAWQHEKIANIVDAIPGPHRNVPATWPDTRFDMVYVLDLDDASGLYSFVQTPQNLLSGDSTELFPI